jgi:hypothetical protein
MHYAARYPYYYRSSGEDTPVVLDSITVPYDTGFAELLLVLPQTYEGDQITWSEGSYDGETSGDYNLSGTTGTVTTLITVTVQAAATPDLLNNKIIWLRENNANTTGNVDNWNNKFNSALDLVKMSDATRPNLNATGLNGLPTYEFTRANNDRLRAEIALGLIGDFTYYLVFQCSNPTLAATSQMLLENTDNDSAFGNTGIQALIREGEIWVDFRKNDGGDQQRVEFPFSDTGWHVLEVKYDANGNDASTRVIKLDGALIHKSTNADPVVHNNNLLKIGSNGFGTTNAIGGAFAELIMNSEFHDNLTESGILQYLAERYNLSLIPFDDTQYRAIDSLSEAWNGLDSILRDDGKYDLVGGTLTGKIYYFEQGATVADWTATLLVDTGVEIQKLKVWGRDGSDRLVLISAHKDLSVVDDNNGNIRIHRADTTDDNGAYSSLTLIDERYYPQGILVQDIDNDGVDEFIFTWQGTTSGEGGVHWFDCSNVNDILNMASWTEHVAIVHESAWWIAGFHNIDGIDRLVFSARNNRNDSSVPGIYYLTPAATITNTWAQTTIDNTNANWGHIDFGNFVGNDGDLIAHNFDDDNVYVYDESDTFAKTTLITGATAEASYNLSTVDVLVNGRNPFILIVENDWCYYISYNGATWDKRKLFQTLEHPADNEILSVDLDDSGFLTITIDDNTGLANSHIYTFRL